MMISMGILVLENQNTTPQNELLEPKVMGVWEMIFLFKWVIFRFHLNCQGCTSFHLFQTVPLVPGQWRGYDEHRASKQKTRRLYPDNSVVKNDRYSYFSWLIFDNPPSNWVGFCISVCTLLKTNSLYLKMDAWKTSFLLWPGLFSGINCQF